MKRTIFYLALLTAICVLVARQWPVDRGGTLIPVMGMDEKFGYINEDGRIVFELQWEAVSPFDNTGIARIKTSNTGLGKWQILDRHAGIQSREWDRIGPFDKAGMAFACEVYDITRGWQTWWWIQRDGTIINTNNPIRPPTWYPAGVDAENTVPFQLVFDQEGMALVPKKFKWGWHDRQGNWAIEPYWDEARPFHACGLARVRRREKWGIIDRDGDIVLSAVWDRIMPFDENGFAKVINEDREGLIDTNGNIVLKAEWRSLNYYAQEDLILAENSEGFGLLDRKGNVVLPFDWQDLWPQANYQQLFTDDGLLAAMRSGKWGWINREGKEVIPLEWDFLFPFHSNGLARVARDDKWGWLDKEGDIAIPVQWEEVDEFDSNGLARVKFESRWGWINKSGEFVIRPFWNDAWNFDREGMALVKGANGWGWINTSGEVVIKPDWEQAAHFDEYGLARVKRFYHDTAWVNRKGEILIPTLSPDGDYYTGVWGRWPKGADPVTLYGEPIKKLSLPNKKFDEYGHLRIGVIEPPTHKIYDTPQPPPEMTSLVDRNGETLVRDANGLMNFDHNNLAWINFDPGKPAITGRYVDTRGNTVIHPGGDWQLLQTGNRWLFEKGIRSPKDYYVLHRKADELGKLQQYWARIREWMGMEVPENKTLCHCYHKSGKLIWSSGWIRYETKCIMVMIGALLVALFALIRPRKAREV